jgi:hypothetical protein
LLKIGPWVFRECSYNHAHRPRREKILHIGLSMAILEAPTGILNHFWIQMAVSEVKPPMAAAQPLLK